MPCTTTLKIAEIIGSESLARAVHDSVQAGLASPFVHVAGGKNSWTVFNYSLSVAIRDIKKHPLGRLFQRLIEYGPHKDDEPETPISDGKTVLSDPECATCVEFIYSHMINRFKGELAELLAIKPVMNLIEKLQKTDRLPIHIDIYFGEVIQEQRKSAESGADGSGKWSGFTKGADGLAIKKLPGGTHKKHTTFVICGVIEVKSMWRSQKTLEGQLNHHVQRLAGGIKLNGKILNSDSLRMGLRKGGTESIPVFIMVTPSAWKLERKWSWEQKDDKRVMHFPDPPEPKEGDLIEEVGPDKWRIKLSWSQEALNQVAYEMTYWYMSQVGTAIYSQKPLPKGWEGMTPEEAGFNAIKMMLYYLPLRVKYFRRPDMSRNQLRKYRRRIDRKATRLYNVYSFGYPLGADSRKMLWPEDFDVKAQ
jgi:hypothetical protein